MADRFVLLVEGPDDRHVLWHLLRYHQVPAQFAVREKEGVEKLIGELHVELLASDLECLGIIVDADENLAARWQSLCHTLTVSGYRDIPLMPDPRGTVIEQEGKPTVGIWLMPDNQLPGKLEHFIECLVPQGDTLWGRASHCVAGIPAEERRFSGPDTIKATVHTWLAWQKEPGRPLGQAITCRYLDPDAPHAQQLIEWLRRLFDL